MRSLSLIFLVLGGFLWDACVQGRAARAAGEVTSEGHLYLLDSNTGHSQRLKRRHVDAPEDRVHKVRLQLVSVNKYIDMELKFGSVWNSTSNVVVRNGEETQRVVHDIPANCFLSGRLSSGDGYASFVFCNGVTGIIHTDKENYVIGNHGNNTFQDVPSNDTDPDLPSLPVTITRGDALAPEGHKGGKVEPLNFEDGVNPDVEDGVPADVPVDGTKESNKDGSLTTTTTTTQSTPVPASGNALVEVGIYINSDYTLQLAKDNLTTVSQITTWIIKRWNLIREVYKNTKSVGMQVDFKIKHIEIWFKNPEFFVPLEKDNTIADHLDQFCKKTPNDGTDHRMMYTWEIKRRTVGLSYIGTVCRPTSKCSIVIPANTAVQRELHELGHNLGLPHENKIEGCDWPYGFMGWQNNPVFKDCYKPIFLAAMAKESFKCLYSLSDEKIQVSSYTDKFIQANQTIIDILEKW